MSETPQAGANWKAGNELKALHRIVKPVDPDDADGSGAEDAPAPVGHNNGPALATVRSASPERVALEEQSRIVDRALATAGEASARAGSTAITAGRELVKLQRIWNAAALVEPTMRRQEILALFERGISYSNIAAKLAISKSSVASVIRNRAKPVRLKPDNSFTKWANDRFGTTKSQIKGYMYAARSASEREVIWRWIAELRGER